MICRREGDGWLLITQPAHAWLSGELAVAWGNEEFAAPSPMAAVVMAARLHDIGWLAWDAAPRLDENGLPVNFLGATLDETAPVWRGGVRQVTLLDPFAGLLVSMHAATIYRRRLETGADPRERRPEAEALLAEQEQIQADLRSRLADHPVYGPAVDPHRLRVAYRWIRVCDLLSLLICSDAFSPSGEIPAVPGASWQDRRALRYQVRGSFQLAVEPWPFDRPVLDLAVQTRYLPQENYPDQATYHSTLGQAPWNPQPVSVSPVSP